MGEFTKIVTDASWDADVLNSDKPVLVDFWAVWCGPCKMVAPILDEIAETHSDSITVAKLNVDENPVIAAAERITSIPTLNVYKGGELVKQVIGAKPKAAHTARRIPPGASATRVVRSRRRSPPSRSPAAAPLFFGFQ